MNVNPNGEKSLKSKIRKQIKRAPKWAQNLLKKAFLNKSGWVTQQVAVKSVSWGMIGAITGQVVLSVSFNKLMKAYGQIGVVGGMVVGMHIGAISAIPMTTARYSIGVYLYGK